jgi:hypothetical protein
LRKISFHVVLTAALGLSGCGTYVPEIQDFGDSQAGHIYVNQIVSNIRCEVRNAVYDLYKQAGEIPDGLKQISFMNDWGAQVTLNLTVDEKGAVSPTSNITPLGQPKNWIFNYGLGATVSSEAQRVDKVSFFYLVSDLRKFRCTDRQAGLLLLSNDLKLEEWLLYATGLPALSLASLPSDPNGPFKSNVLFHEVKFDVITTGSASPGWKLINATINQSGTFLTATRDRTHDLQITLGPTTPAPSDPNKAKQLANAANNADLAGQIGTAVANAIKQNVSPIQFFPFF